MEIYTKNNRSVAVIDPKTAVHSVQDALDLMVSAQYQAGCDAIAIYRESLSDDFFDLKTRLAGEILQKFSNYQVRLAIIGDFSGYKSKALHDFIYECNQRGPVFWVKTLEAALDALTS